MSDIKGVEVLGTKASNRLAVIATHTGANSIRVIEGHLHVQHPEDGVVAVYVPGEWHGSRLI
jgi:hypothetical protein